MFALLFLSLSLSVIDDSQPLITQELVDQINNNPNSPFKAILHPEFAEMTVRQARRFLAPVRKGVVSGRGHGSPRPVGADEKKYSSHDTKFITGYYDSNGHYAWTENYTYVVYDNKEFCSSWAPAVTSAMSLALSIHHRHWIKLSVVFILDCDLIDDPCVDRPPLSAYEQFWRRYIPLDDEWRNLTQLPSNYVINDLCDNPLECYPDFNNCQRKLVLTGSCEAGETDIQCPIYFLYNWRWIKSHLWEVGPVTSSIVVGPAFFAYHFGVYSALPMSNPSVTYGDNGVFITGAYSGHRPSGPMGEALGMLDVTIIGWGQVEANLSEKPSRHKNMYNRWWYVIPHLGTKFGEPCDWVFENMSNVTCPGERTVYMMGNHSYSGIMRINRRFDDSYIESHAVGAVPFNFNPEPRPPARPTPSPTPGPTPGPSPSPSFSPIPGSSSDFSGPYFHNHRLVS
jgi:hypothetical protein